MQGTARQNKERKQEEAKFRAIAREMRTDEQQLKRLEESGHGHCKEAIRLREKLGVK